MLGTHRILGSAEESSKRRRPKPVVDKSRRALQAATETPVLELANEESKPLIISASEAILWFMSKDSRAADPTISAARRDIAEELKVRRVGRRERVVSVVEWWSLFRHLLIKGRRELGFRDERAASTTAKAVSSLMSSDSGFLFLVPRFSICLSSR